MVDGPTVSDQTVLYETDGAVGVITLNRPERLNAINLELLGGFAAHLKAARKDDGVRVVVVTGAGRAFCGGDDLKEVSAGKSVDYWREEIDAIQNIQRLVVGLGKPSIAAIRGYAVGGGCEFAVGCDLRVASEESNFGFPEASLGFLPSSGSSKLLVHLVGLGKAKELLFTGKFIGAEEAHRIGLVNEVVPDDLLMEETMKMAQDIVEKSPLSIRLTRSAVDKGMDLNLEEVLDMEATYFMKVLQAQDFEDRVEDRLWKMEQDGR